MKRSSGKRPVGRPRLGPVIETAIKALRQGGMGMHQIARQLRVGVSVVQRIDAELRQEREKARASEEANATAAREEASASIADFEAEVRKDGW